MKTNTGDRHAAEPSKIGPLYSTSVSTETAGLLLCTQFCLSVTAENNTTEKLLLPYMQTKGC